MSSDPSQILRMFYRDLIQQLTGMEGVAEVRLAPHDPDDRDPQRLTAAVVLPAGQADDDVIVIEVSLPDPGYDMRTWPEAAAVDRPAF
ncbi:hypothetical protein GCM10010156_49700 [Planobispora rosea]|uniref:Uncharacterized protein n=1 Tax=Planobispora rosea TaxID=35762 RepID=A0A8J3S5S2_PLARO|nr:hypothetical protein [Planobispora rosea]GGS85149.1 hypothetical protein GCM10010156_49700 [Planobispora rosea]GIH86481.1 hypothetical protein Pro02_48890 [Planobispora rosea]